ncbi:Zinc-finger double-stranded RNA-binding family protein [Leishmania donovani]|uniref:Zinc-finger double-stranded RNA-binding family protein n=1 Tax=Leishmania donovani TaxID=5661 RepID=A0A504Y1Q5_LEIDO|nr:Zinc-finger double-stranded RNA-binding family protein [Leishmania donovani]
MSAPHLLSFLHPAASCSPPPIAVPTWMLATEERLGRQAVHIAELEARHDITALLTRSYFAMSTSCPRSEWRPVRLEPDSQLECLAAASSSHSENDGDTLPLSSFWQQLADLDERLTEVEWATVHCKGSQPTADARRPQQPRVNSSRPTMDDCVALLDSLLASQEGTRTPQWDDATAGAALPRRQRRQQRPSQETERHLPLQLHSRQQCMLSILAKLRDALRSTQASYKAATGIRAPVSLETLLQLPPETLPLLMCTDDGMHDVRQPQCRHHCDASGGTAACCGLLSSTSIYTLWATLMDGVDMFPSFSRAVAEALWAAARQRLTVRHQRVIAPTLKSRLQEEEERWAYRDFPVRRGFTAPTVYDDLFPLPTAVSAFVEPPLYTVPSPSLLTGRSSGAAVAEAKEEAATTRRRRSARKSCIIELPSAGASSSPMSTDRCSFYCPVCNIQFSDSHAAEAHKASRQHKRKSGELEWEAQQYKKDADVTPDDVWALVRRKQAELHVIPWSELKYSEEESTA